ncbi:MAG TPA: ABC transporter permease [Gammaproteobacteria bacterium]|nr:ABC transporter permease [Gammaproteobacteria bacterium]
MNLNKLAWRNLWRRKRRTLITAFSIAFGVMLAVTFTGAGDHYYTRMIDAGASMGMGHVTIEPIDYNRAPSLKKRLNEVQTLREKALARPEVADAMVRISGQAMFASAHKSVGGMFIAIDPAQESEKSNLFIRSMIKGSLFDSADSPGIVVGVKLAKKLQLRIGKKVVYTTTDAHGEIVSAIERVTGIFKTGVSEVDSAMALLPIKRVQKTLDYKADEATLVALILDDQRRTLKLRNTLAALPVYANTEVLTWQESQPDLASMIAMDKSTNYISQFLIALLVAAGILNTMLMSVLERKREFGVMMAVGMTPFNLFRLVMIESFWLAVVGLIIGIIITTPWFIYMNQIGIDLSGAYGDDMDFGGVLIDPVMKIRLFQESIIAILSGLFILALASGAYPAWRAGRIPPIDSLKIN